jgi:glycerate kinase
MIEKLEAGLQKLARIAKRDLGRDLSREPGAGAAGGCGFGMMAFFRAKRENGFQLIRRVTKLDALIRGHDLVITGEGCFDRTSLLGKAPAQLGRLARELRVPAWALCGRVDAAVRSPFDRIDALSTPENSGPPPEAIAEPEHARRLEELAYRTARAWLVIPPRKA